MTNLRVLIADDEPVAVERLELALSCVPETQIIGVARNGRDALALIRELHPDIAILDIQMPGQSGFAILSNLRPRERIPEVIFVTAHDEHAVKAFEVHAVDYLLKPVPFERLREAIRRARERLAARAADDRFAELQKVILSLSSKENGKQPYERELWVKDREGITRIPATDIDYLEAAGDYVVAHVGEATHLLSDSMASLESRLDPAILMRVHRSSMVNLSSVRRLKRRSGRALALVLSSGRQIAVGPKYVDSVLDAINAKRWR